MDKTIDFSAVDRLIEASYPQLEADVLRLVSIPSVEMEPQPGMPFGPEIARAVDCALEISSKLGFVGSNVDGYCAVADLPGLNPEQVGILGHLDVVPAEGQVWTTPPFAPQVRQGRIYGRGVVDDKGPLLAAMYGAWALREAGLVCKRSVRFIMGCNEESGCNCVKYYLSKYDPPACGFTPDASFPVVIGEKGIVHFRLRQAWPIAGSAPFSLLCAQAGSAANVVPAMAEARLSGDATALPPLPDGIVLREEADALVLCATGIGAHASTPEEGENALSRLVAYLAQIDVAPQGASAFLQRAAQWSRLDDYTGAGLGIADADAQSSSTLVCSSLRLSAQDGELGFDLRFPVSRSAEEVVCRLKQLAADNHMELELTHVAEPLFLGEKNRLGETLLRVYREITGDMHAPLVIGGGTYAKEIPGFVAFGPELADAPMLCHQADEYMECAHLLRCAKIYARAIYELAK